MIDKTSVNSPQNRRQAKTNYGTKGFNVKKTEEIIGDGDKSDVNSDGIN